MKLRKGKANDIQEENTNNRRKTNDKQEQPISKKAIRMRRCRAKLKYDNTEKYEEMKKKDANRNNRKLPSQKIQKDKNEAERQR